MNSKKPNKSSEEILVKLKDKLTKNFDKLLLEIELNFKEITIEIDSKNLIQVATLLKSEEEFAFDTLIDLCGIDYLDFTAQKQLSRFAVVIHLLSTTKNYRLRLKVFCSDDSLPQAPSLTKIWPCSEWYEREAFDMFGIVFDGNEDLRRILTDYGFVGHPFRKDFPISGFVEMRYDPIEKRVIYQPVTIEKRENTPRIVREEDYGKTFDHG